MSFRAFCGGHLFWNTSLLTNNSWPEFTPCFQITALVWVPCGWLWLTLPVFLWYLHRQPGTLPFSRLTTAKLVVVVVLALLALGDMVRGGLDTKDPLYSSVVLYLAGCLKIVTFALSFYLTVISRRKGLPSPCLLFIFWFLMLAMNVVPFYSLIIQKESRSTAQLVVFYLFFTCVMLQFVLQCYAEKIDISSQDTEKEKSPCPENTASFLSKITFYWMNGLVWAGCQKPITAKDLWDLPPHMKSNVVVPPFETGWNWEVNKVKATRKPKEYRLRPQAKSRTSEAKSWTSESTSVVGNNHEEKHSLLELTPLNEKTDQPKETSDDEPKVVIKDKSSDSGHQQKPSLVRVLFRTYYPEMLRSHGFRVTADIVQFANPLLLKTLISYVENRNKERDWEGFALVIAFFIVSFLHSLIFNQSFYLGFNLAMKIKTALLAAVYKKSLTMNNMSRRQFTTGTIVNLMAIDCQRVQEVVGILYIIWSAPLQISLALYFLYNTIGLAFLGGVAVMGLVAPFNMRLSMYMRHYQSKQLTIKDERLKMMNEVLSGIRVLKLCAWEKSFEEKIMAIRNLEMHNLKRLAILSACNVFCWVGAPALVTLASFLMYVLMIDHHYLNSQTAFVAISLFGILRQPMNQLPMCISYMVQALVSVDRLQQYLSGADLDPENVQTDPEEGICISVDQGSFTWDREQVDTLKNITLKIPKGQLVAVVGAVGSGKSSLLSAFLGELEKKHGSVNMKGSVAYVPQQAWIQNLSLRNNMLFGSEMEERCYWEVLRACALEADLAVLPGGELTEIGEKGINLSGGQKQRVSLARAVYSDMDIYLMDDPLSAVDSHVGKHIFSKVIGNQGLLKEKTRVLVTHGVHWLPMVDTIIVIDKGEITEMGSYEELLSHDGPFAQFLKTYLMQDDRKGTDDEEIQDINSLMLERVDSVSSVGALSNGKMSPSCSSLGKGSAGEDVFLRSVSVVSEDDVTLETADQTQNETKHDHDSADEEQHRLVGDERSEIGKISWHVIATYLHALGTKAGVSIIMMFTLQQILNVSGNIWLSVWTEDPDLKNATNNAVINSSSHLTSLSYRYLGVYSGLSVAQAIIVLLYVMTIYIHMVAASGIIHKTLLSNVLHQPMAFFDTTPIGRIMNRFTRDVDTLDSLLPRIVRMWFNSIFSILSIMIVISYSTPFFLAAAVPIFCIYFFIQRIYIPTSRQLKRNESTSRSPIYTHFSETINGASSIRAYGARNRFFRESLERVDKNNIFYYAALTANRWLRIRLELLGNIVVMSASLFAVITPNVSGGLVGLSVSYALQVTNFLNMMVQITTQLETNIVSVERIVEYTELPQEAEWIISNKRPPDSWPDNGDVLFDDLQLRYRPDLDLVLKGISCHIRSGEKIGVVGRTGAGKSSLTLALFRIIEAAGGNIIIDGQNISEMGLHDLRSRLTILPQDPVLFSGTLRLNLDPFDQHSDDDLWLALDRAHLKTFISELPKGLLHECEEGGQNLSVGQRQLVCLARSLLRKTKLLILDEATAAVDMETDDLIQKTIRTAFHDCTVLSIAHRINTIMDYDRIMVLDVGEIAEFDTPNNLLGDKGSMFYSLARDANLTS